jgi:hypothetical protein
MEHDILYIIAIPERASGKKEETPSCCPHSPLRLAPREAVVHVEYLIYIRNAYFKVRLEYSTGRRALEKGKKYERYEANMLPTTTLKGSTKLELWMEELGEGSVGCRKGRGK